MLKIKDNVNFKDLIQYGFKRMQYLPIYQKLVFYDENKLYCYIEYQINTKTRYIEIRTNCIGDRYIDFILDDTIYNLIKADLVEKDGNNVSDRD